MHPVIALFRRNAWATDRLLAFCENRPEAAAHADGDVYGNIDALFNHIVSSEPGYLRLVTGRLPKDRVLLSEPRPLGDLRQPVESLLELWLATLQTERDPEVVQPFQRGDDQELMPDWLPLVQTVHHGDDHRTQVNTLLSRHGIEAPELDGWAFAEAVPAAADGEVRGWWAPLLRRCFGHHLWATERLLDHCRALTAEQLALTAPGTYGTIIDTLDHLVSADRSYLAGVTVGGRLPALDAGGPGPLLEHLARSRQGWFAYLDSEPDFDVMIDRRTGRYPAWVLVLQAIHHGNDHRTHAGTALLRHGLEPGDIDVWGYGMAEGKLQFPKEPPPPAPWKLSSAR
jgi:uncharacterized damage-inducible protein DinB